jgi:hypothetical protein
MKKPLNPPTYTAMKRERHRFTNPWADDPRFVALGVVMMTQYAIDEKTHITTRLELYAIEGGNDYDTHFGARHGNEGSSYYSGGAGLWRDVGSNSPPGIAARTWLYHKAFGKIHPQVHT